MQARGVCGFSGGLPRLHLLDGVGFAGELRRQGLLQAGREALVRLLKAHYRAAQEILASAPERVPGVALVRYRLRFIVVGLRIRLRRPRYSLPLCGVHRRLKESARVDEGERDEDARATGGGFEEPMPIK